MTPVGLGTSPLLRYRTGARDGGWGLQKVLWVAAPTYVGPVLIRGGRVDGQGSVGFNVGGTPSVEGPPFAELQFPPGQAPAGNSGWRNWPSYTRVQAPGCYAYQVDGEDFSYVLVFRAAPLD